MIVGAFIGVLFLMVVFTAYRLTTRLSERTASDVPLFLQKMEMEALYGAFHPEADEHFRSTLSPRNSGRCNGSGSTACISKILCQCRVIRAGSNTSVAKTGTCWKPTFNGPFFPCRTPACNAGFLH